MRRSDRRRACTPSSAMEAEERRRELQKLAVLGQLSSEAAHEFNNLLTIIVGNVVELKRGLDSSDPLQARAEQILLASERAGAFAKQILDFGRPQSSDSRIFHVGDRVAGLSGMLQTLLGRRWKLELSVDREGCLAVADPNQIDQVVVNLALNARDAMPTGGAVRIEVAGDAAESDFVSISVSDTGCGISDNLRERIFSPFFTTKPRGRGTGLGLTICLGIVRHFGGSIDIDSVPAVGSTFTVRLPRLQTSRDGADVPHLRATCQNSS